MGMPRTSRSFTVEEYYRMGASASASAPNRSPTSRCCAREPTHTAAGIPDRRILLLIEVADASLERDRQVKVPLYAAAGIPEVWLVNLSSQVVTHYTDPGPGGYAAIRPARRGESVTAGQLAGVTVRVDDILG